ncbi:MAG: tetratricopeptide repeat protein [Candidatus Sumerlaeia bacterium]|nr:tetratricopeptide repeat protein [Candidatus Sumerlaeia bacterium]
MPQVSKNTTSDKKSPRDIADQISRQVNALRDAGLDALDRGETAKAIACFRKALSLAPFSKDLKDCFEDALYEQALVLEERRHAARERREASRSARPAHRRSRREEPELEEEVEVAPRRPAKTRQQKPSPLQGIQWAPILTGVRVGFVTCLAILLTGGVLFGVNRAMGYVGGLFSGGGDSVPMVSNSNRVPAEIADLTEKATARLRDGKPEEAIEILRAAISDHPAHRDHLSPALVTAIRVQAGVEHRSRRFEQAARLYREAGELTPRNPNNWIDLGLALVQQARGTSGASQVAQKRSLLNEAEEAFKKSLELSPGNSSALLGLADAYAAANERGKAAETYERILASAPESPEGIRAEAALTQLRRR